MAYKNNFKFRTNTTQKNTKILNKQDNKERILELEEKGFKGNNEHDELSDIIKAEEFNYLFKEVENNFNNIEKDNTELWFNLKEHDTKFNKNDSDIASIKSRLSTNESDITNIKSKNIIQENLLLTHGSEIDKNKSNISDLQSSKLNRSGGSIVGNLTISGNLDAYYIHGDTISIKNVVPIDDNFNKLLTLVKPVGSSNVNLVGAVQKWDIKKGLGIDKLEIESRKIEKLKNDIEALKSERLALKEEWEELKKKLNNHAVVDYINGTEGHIRHHIIRDSINYDEYGIGSYFYINEEKYKYYPSINEIYFIKFKINFFRKSESWYNEGYRYEDLILITSEFTKNFSVFSSDLVGDMKLSFKDSITFPFNCSYKKENSVVEYNFTLKAKPLKNITSGRIIIYDWRNFVVRISNVNVKETFDNSTLYREEYNGDDENGDDDTYLEVIPYVYYKEDND